jgi:hypothetical protein
MMQPLWLAGPTIIINSSIAEQHSHTLQNHNNVRFEILKEVWPKFILAQFIYWMMNMCDMYTNICTEKNGQKAF